MTVMRVRFLLLPLTVSAWTACGQDKPIPTLDVDTGPGGAIADTEDTSDLDTEATNAVAADELPSDATPVDVSSDVTWVVSDNDPTDIGIDPPPGVCLDDPSVPVAGTACTTPGAMHCTNRAVRAIVAIPQAGQYSCLRRWLVVCEGPPGQETWQWRHVAHVPAFVEAAVSWATTKCLVNPYTFWTCQESGAGAIITGLHAYATNEAHATSKLAEKVRLCEPSQAGKQVCNEWNMATCGTAADMPASLNLATAYANCFDMAKPGYFWWWTQNCGDISCVKLMPDGQSVKLPVSRACINDEKAGAHCAYNCKEMGLKD